jgi:dsRNA-specific ribonuclease
MARNDAAFQAYKALHQSGLVNDNMLPYRTEDDAETATFQIPDHTPALVQVSPPFIPWISVANQQRQSPLIYYRTLLKASAPELGLSSMVLFTPCPTPEVPGFLLHWSEAKRFSVQSSPLSKTVLTEEELSTMRRITRKVLSSVLNGKWTQESREDFLWLIAPYDVDTAGHIVNSRLAHFDTLTNGQTSASYLLQQTGCATAQWGLVSLSGDAKKYILQTIRDGAALPIGPSEALMEVVRTPKRRDFLHRIPAGTKKNEAYTKVELLSPTDCVVDNLPAAYSIFALLVPSIIYKLEMFMSADVLRTTILKPVSFEPDHTALLVQAITSSATGEEDNYQRLEFLGDCILKYIASVHLMAAHLLKTESFLTGRKGKVVSNGFLARATMEAGLDRFIITKRFTGKSWTPHFASDILKGQDEAGNETEERTTPVVLRSSKLLADVIESLIGASYIIGGFDKAFTCIQTLLPLEDWTPISKATTLLFSSAPTDFSPSNLSTLEQLIGHTFTKKLLLLEALTHASYTGVHAHVRSYERLEFLGDAVLDYIISTLLFRHSPELPHQQMHGIRTAMANAAFLAFRMFETTISEERINTATLEPERVSRQIWQFLRHASSPDMISARETALRQHAASRTAILHSLTHDSRYPWHLFASNDAPKFFSDIVESIIGAVYVDTQGDISACKEVVRRLGILDCLERILRDRVDCLHPKERLGILAVDKGVEYVRVGEEGRKEGERENGEAEEAGKKGVWKCQVRVGGVDIGGPVEGLKRLNAETIAAWRAVQILEAKKEEDVVMRDVNEMLMEEADSGDDEGEDWHDAEEGGVMLDVTL